MQNYLNNNLLLIKEFKELYKNGIDTSAVLKKFRENGFTAQTGANSASTERVFRYQLNIDSDCF